MPLRDKEVIEALSPIREPADETPKPLLLAAIEAAAQVRPEEAPLILADFAESPDEEIVEAAQEALAMAEGLSDEDDLDQDDEDLDDDDDDRF